MLVRDSEGVSKDRGLLTGVIFGEDLVVWIAGGSLAVVVFSEDTQLAQWERSLRVKGVRL